MNEATKRAVLRWVHLVFGLLPILGYVYSPFDQLPSFASLVRFVFVPILLLTGYWMYAGLLFGIIGIALWLGAYLLGEQSPAMGGYNAAILSQVALFLIWKLWLGKRKKQRQSANPA